MKKNSSPRIFPDGTKCWSGPNCRRHQGKIVNPFSEPNTVTVKAVQSLKQATREQLLTSKCLQYAIVLSESYGSRKVVVTYMPQEDGGKHPIHVYGLKNNSTVGDVHGEQPFPHANGFLKTEILDSGKALELYGSYFQ